MNKKTRDELSKIHERLIDIKDELSIIGEDEDDKFNNLNEGLQATERGQQMQNDSDNLLEAVSEIEQALEYIENVTNV